MTTRNIREARAGITLTECLIAILIMGIGLVSIATLFPLGLVRLREAQRLIRSSYLLESAASDLSARGLLNAQSFMAAEMINQYQGLNRFYPSNLSAQLSFNPLQIDAPVYSTDFTANDPYNTFTVGAQTFNTGADGRLYSGAESVVGIPFAYDPLWRFQTYAPGATVQGIYQYDAMGSGIVPECRYGSGLGWVRPDPDGNGPASAHGLQRLTNFNGRSYTVAGVSYPIQQTANRVPSIFVSPEDVVWNQANNTNNLSTVLPDLTMNSGGTFAAPTNDWRYSWMFTGRQATTANGSTYDGDIVVYENRPFALDPVSEPFPGGSGYRPADEMVVEAVFGYGANVVDNGSGFGYAAAADKTVLLRWPSTIPDPPLKMGDWICDVTYERSQAMVLTRFTPVSNVYNSFAFDNLPAQRAYWYQIGKITPATVDPGFTGDPNVGFRRMIVQVNSPLRARTPMSTAGSPMNVNAALLAPHVVNVIPQTITVH